MAHDAVSIMSFSCILVVNLSSHVYTQDSIMCY